jgi:hypothetical protein
MAARPDYASFLTSHAAALGIPAEIALRVMGAESGGDPTAESPRGASGLMQLMPDTARAMGVTNPSDPYQNIEGGLKYLKQQYDQFGSWPLALRAYNAGPGRVRESFRYPETNAYVAEIMGMPAALDQALQTQRGAQSAAVSDPMLQQALQQHAALSAQRNASADKLQPLADRATALAFQPTEAVPEPPSLRDLPEAPKAPQTDKMRVFGQLMPVLAAFGSLMTRGGAVNALNTATAAMNAAKAKDDDAYEKSRQQWLDHTEEALKQNAVEMERYRAVLDKHHETVSDKMAELQGIAAANNDQLTLERLRSGNLDEFEKIIGMRDQAAGRLTDLVESERSHDERQQQLKMEQQRIDLSKRAEDFQEKYGVPVDRKILDDFHSEHPDATAEQEAQFMGSFAASKRITAQQLAQSGLSADAQKFVDDYQNLPESGDPAKETLEFKGHKFTKAQIDQALGTQFPTQEQKEIAEIFKQAMKPIIPNSFSGAAPGDQQQHAPAGVADLPAGDKPPADHPDAKKAPDGHWYVKKGDQFYLVGE